MSAKTKVLIGLVATAGLAAGIVGTVLLSKLAEKQGAKPIEMEINAQIFEATPARELIIMEADGRVFSGATKKELVQISTLHYASRAKFTYSVDVRKINREHFKYNSHDDTLTVILPSIIVRTNVYGPRERLANLAFLASEGNSGNELERVAKLALEKDANREGSRPGLIIAATKSAKHEVSELYEDALRASGHTTRVVVLANGEK